LEDRRKKALFRACAMAKTVKLLVDTPLMAEDGALEPSARDAILDLSEKLEPSQG
jgi:hypothetical protein